VTILKFKKWKDQYYSADTDTFQIIKNSQCQLPIGFSEDRLTHYQSLFAMNNMSLEILQEDIDETVKEIENVK
jgi:hypothetical protein